MIHQTQPTSNSCMHTCLAMFAGYKVEKLNEVPELKNMKIDLSRSMTFHDFIRAATMLNIYCMPAISYACSPGSVYLLTVPSLNIKGGNHAVLLDWTDPEDPMILDPNEGREGSLTYNTKEFLAGMSYSVSFILKNVEEDNFRAYPF